MDKNVVFVWKLPGKMVSSEVAILGALPEAKWSKNIFFIRDLNKKKSGHLKWPFWGHSMKPNDQKLILCQGTRW
jgi:hypothetical protein